jgi:hypothetical protein
MAKKPIRWTVRLSGKGGKEEERKTFAGMIDVVDAFASDKKVDGDRFVQITGRRDDAVVVDTSWKVSSLRELGIEAFEGLYTDWSGR